MFGVLHTSPEAFLGDPSPAATKTFLRLQGGHNVSVVESTAAAFERLRPFLTPERVTADQLRHKDLDEPFLQAELDAVAHLLTEFNAINVSAMDSYSKAKDKAKLYQRKTAVASHLRLVLELYVAAMRRTEQRHDAAKTRMPKALRRDIERHARGGDLHAPGELAVYYGVEESALRETLDAYVEEAKRSLWLEE